MTLEPYQQSAPEASSNRRLFAPGTYTSIPKALLADGIGLAAKVVYLGLACYLSADGCQVWPGTAELSRKTGLSRRAIQQGIEALVSAGWITKSTAGGPVGGNGQRTNLYTLRQQRTSCTSAPDALVDSARNALGVAHDVRGGSARNAHEELDRRTPLKKKRRAAVRRAPSDPRIKEFIDWFSASFEKSRGVKYIVQGAKDGATVKRLLASLDLDELKNATHAMLADSWGSQRASIGLLASQINSWRGKPTKTPANGRAGFTPAKPGQSYNGLAKRFE